MLLGHSTFSFKLLLVSKLFSTQIAVFSLLFLFLYLIHSNTSGLRNEKQDMEDINEADKIDEIMLPGFRFHPTDEELVGFYLTRKVQHKPLTIELISQLDIYKFDPWDLPKLARNGEKECYFYCPRDRKYRNSARPNRVTGAGFWKATGTDRPIYSSQGSKCIGLKKSLVFYRGKAARGMKTDWMMHEFRLPSLSDSVSLKTPYLDKNNIPANEAWAICRIFKKANSTKQRALSHSWVSPLSDHVINPPNNVDFSSSNSTITMANQTINEPLQFEYGNNSTTEKSSIARLSTAYFPPSKQIYYNINMDAKPNSTCYPSRLASDVAINEVSSWFLDMPSSSLLGDLGNGSENLELSVFDEQCRGFSAMVGEGVQENIGYGEEVVLVKEQSLREADDEWETMSFPSSLDEAWKQNSMWDSSPFPSYLSTN